MGFYLDTLEDELLSLLTSVSPKSNPQALNHAEEREEVAPKEGGWMEVGRKNRMVVTRTVCDDFSVFGGSNLPDRLRPVILPSPAYSEALSVLRFACHNTRTP